MQLGATLDCIKGEKLLYQLKLFKNECVMKLLQYFVGEALASM